MEKNMKNSRGKGEKHEDDDDTRRRDTAMANSRPAKRRKVDDEEVNLSSSLCGFVTSPVQKIGESKDHFSGGSSDEVPASCCSSNRSNEDESDEIEYGFHCGESRETTPSNEIRSESGELESTEMPLESRQQKPMEKSSTDRAKLEAELEEFFLTGEKQHLKQYSKKYNFDFEKEKPLEGRFDWAKLNP